MADSTLKPCPFCGNTVSLSPEGDRSIAWVWCSNCRTTGPAALDEREVVSDKEIAELERRAAEAWNKRSSPQTSSLTEFAIVRKVEIIEVKTQREQGNVSRYVKIKIEGCDDNPSLFMAVDEELAEFQAALVNGTRIECTIAVHPLEP